MDFYGLAGWLAVFFAIDAQHCKSEEIIEDKKISIIPLWKWLLNF
jgi:predicted AAA+ superfamily ATPase